MGDHIVIPLEELARGFDLTVENAVDLVSSAVDLHERRSKALALAQLGQEEVGKSLMILSACGLSAYPESWSSFWQGWRKHDLKARKAELYGRLAFVRIGLNNPDGTVHDGSSLRARLSAEKEAGFYVDFDQVGGKFTSPKDDVPGFESWNRIMTLLGHAMTADAVNRALRAEDPEFRFREFGSLAQYLCNDEPDQEAFSDRFLQFRTVSKAHEALFDDMMVALEAPRQLLREASSASAKMKYSAG